jgi:four helix bundle protein
VSEEIEIKKKIISFKDLDVYQRAYKASIQVMTKILLSLPESEKFDLKDQLSRSCKAVPRLIAEGYAKRHQMRGFQKYLDDARGECNELIVSLDHCADVYGSKMDKKLCVELAKEYDIIGRQLYRLAQSWSLLKGDL